MLIWVLVGAPALAVAYDTKVGPVLVDLSATHGVHLGDVAAVAVAGVAGLALSLATRRRGAGGRRGRSWPGSPGR